MAHKVIEEMRVMLAKRQQKLTVAMQDVSRWKGQMDDAQVRVNELTEAISHLSAVIALAERGQFIDPPGPLEEIDLEEAEKAAEAGIALSMQRVRQGSSTQD